MREYRYWLIVIGIGLLPLINPHSSQAAGAARAVMIFDGVATEVADPPASVQSTSRLSPSSQPTDLWVTLADLKRATGFEVKPQGVCRKELCFPLPKDKRSDFLAKAPSVQNAAGRETLTWFNLSAFARMIHQAVAYDAPHRTWYIGPRPDVQNAYLSSLDAPNFTLPDMNGKQHSLSDFRGKKVLLITWASW